MAPNKSVLDGLLKSVLARGSLVFGWPSRIDERHNPQAVLKLCSILLSSRGEATGMALAEEILSIWSLLGQDERLEIMHALLVDFGPDISLLEKTIADYRSNPTFENLSKLHMASEPRRQELIRRLNLARNGVATLVDMREQLQDFIRNHKELTVVDADFLHLFSSWFNRGFLILRRIDWSTPANILEKIIRYEAVHEIKDWKDLRQRLEPEDRRCYAFFHPQLPDEPLIFVEIALTEEISASISHLLADQRELIPAGEANTAVFYSISNCQAGLRGVSFGNFLIKQVVEELQRDLPNLKTFVTLSPVPGLAAWLSDHGHPAEMGNTTRDRLMAGTLEYFFSGKKADGRHCDPVARFHLGNGARLERIVMEADRSERSMRQSFGVMVNYLYKPDEIEANHEAYVQHGDVAASRELQRLWQSARSQNKLGATGNRAGHIAGSTHGQSSL